MIVFYIKHSISKELANFPDLHFVLSGFTTYLASHFGKSFSSHSYCYDYSNDSPNCFASCTVNSRALVHYVG